MAAPAEGPAQPGDTGHTTPAPALTPGAAQPHTAYNNPAH